MYYSQVGEDKYLNDNIFKNKKNGIYIELGALDGVLYSNTKFFEDNLGWTGILIEPHPTNYEKLLTFRKGNKIYNELVSDCIQDLKFRYFENAYSAVSGVENTLSKHHYDTYFNAEDKKHFKQNNKIFKTKTLTEIIMDAGFDKIDFLSLDVEGHEFEVLNGWNFSIPIQVILIELLGVNKEKEDMCREKLINNGYYYYDTYKHNEIYIHSSFKHDDEQKKDVISFDIFDTLITRLCKEPTDIFDYVEKNFRINNFKKLRLLAQNTSNGTFENIYDNFKKITNLDNTIIEQLKEIEIQSEINNLIPIQTNINLINNGDILISDMYLPEEILYRLIQANGINKDVTIYVSPSGKSSGLMWEKLNSKYNIKLHVGDNLHSDILMAERYGIMTKHTKAHEFSLFENIIYDTNILNFFRKFRLQNPYIENSYEYILYKEQAEFNIPIICFILKKIVKILECENRKTVLFVTRDCTLIKKIFNEFYPNYKSINFHSSRIINKNYNDDYIKYLKNIYNEKDCLIVDLHGSFNSGRELFLKLFNHLPRVYIFDYSGQNEIFNNLSFSTKCSNVIETFNVSNVGTLVSFEKENDIRAPLEINNKFVKTIFDAINKFITYGKNNNFKKVLDNAIFDNEETLKVFYSQISTYKPLIINRLDHMSLTKIANKYNSDKGDTYKCSHQYTEIYEKVIDNICNKKFSEKIKLLEIGLCRDPVLDIPSLKMWNEYFNGNIELFGFDINKDFEVFNNNNIKISIGDQSNINDLQKIKNNKYHIIIDDGYHASKHQQVSFKELWDNVIDGGCYIIEDLHYQPEKETCMKTKELLLEWKNNNFISSEFITNTDIEKIKNSIDFIEFADSKSKLWEKELLKNALAIIYKKKQKIS